MLTLSKGSTDVPTSSQIQLLTLKAINARQLKAAGSQSLNTDSLLSLSLKKYTAY